MSKRQQLCIVAILIPLLYLSGIPSFWKGIVFVLIGLYLIAFAYRTRIEPVTVSHEQVNHIPESAPIVEDAQPEIASIRTDGTE